MQVATKVTETVTAIALKKVKFLRENLREKLFVERFEKNIQKANTYPENNKAQRKNIMEIKNKFAIFCYASIFFAFIL